jgi:hypothetical protein
MPDIAEAADEEAALEQLHRKGYTDGLPVVIPTPRRVDEMIRAGGYDPDVSLGAVGPSQAAATIQAVAVNAVMAGCLPTHFPVVIAAVRAICDPEFDLTEVQVTTHAVTPLLVVNGPAREQCGLSSGFGAFGPGHRANACIGRAVRLVMMNIGGGLPGVTDMAIYGHPAKFTFCVAEDEEGSPWPALHVSRGWRADQSTVTVTAVEGPHSVICAPMSPDCVDMAVPAGIDVIASAVGSLGSNTTYFERGTIVVVINQLLARMFADAGYSREMMQQQLVERSRHPRRVLRRLNPGLMPPGPDDDLVPHRDPRTILIAVAGGRGNYAMVCPTLGVGPHNNTAVTKEIEINQMCMLPSSTQ